MQLLAVSQLPPGSLAELAMCHEQLRLLAWRAVQAWCQPGRPGFGPLELNCGWRVRSLAELQAVLAASHPQPPTQQHSAPPAVPQWAWPAPKMPQQQGSPPADSTGSAGAARPVLSAASAVVRCHSSPTAAGGAPAQGGDEVSSRPAKRRCLRAQQSAPPALRAAAAPTRSAPVSRPPVELPGFSEEEVQLLQECLQVPTPHQSREDAAAAPAPAASAAGSTCSA